MSILDICLFVCVVGFGQSISDLQCVCFVGPPMICVEMLISVQIISPSKSMRCPGGVAGRTCFSLLSPSFFLPLLIFSQRGSCRVLKFVIRHCVTKRIRLHPMTINNQKMR